MLFYTQPRKPETLSYSRFLKSIRHFMFSMVSISGLTDVHKKKIKEKSKIFKNQTNKYNCPYCFE